MGPDSLRLVTNERGADVRWPCGAPVVSAEVRALYAPLLERLACWSEVDPRRSALVEEAAEVWSRPGFDTVLSASR